MEYGLIGEKLGHSASKEIHEQLADYSYELHPLTKEDFPIFMEEKAFRALNVTIPYKQAVIPYLTAMDENAKAIGAVNTIVNQNGSLYGYNTDMPGFLYMVKKNGIDMEGKKVVVLGNGGASQAIQAGVKKMNPAKMIVVGNRTIKEGVLTYEQCFALHSDADIVVNTSPVGMYPNVDFSPVDLTHFPQCQAVIDIIANPLTTKLVAQARELGMKGITGLEMLIAQAKYAVEIFLDTHLEDARIAEINTPLLKERSNLVLVGMSGGGKSTIGKRAAEKLGKGFVDTDELIIERIKMPIAEFFAKEGEPAFREIETKVIHEVSAQNNLVIATGGGIIKNPLNVEYLKRNGRLIWLKRDADLLQTGNGRPLAPDQAAAQKLYQERLPLYTAAAEAIAENNGTFEEGLSAVLQCYESLLK